MKKMFLIILLSIILISFCFIFFSSDINTNNEKFLLRFGIEINPLPISFEELKIPERFDSVYMNYNLLQIESGFNLLDYAGCDAVRYTYKILNFPENYKKEVYANVICVNRKPVGGDIACPSIDGFMLPLNYLMSD